MFHSLVPCNASMRRKLARPTARPAVAPRRALGNGGGLLAVLVLGLGAGCTDGAGALAHKHSASLADTTINFDDLPAGTVVTTQYQALGITFTLDSPHGLQTAALGSAPSSPNAVDLSVRYPLEFPGAKLEGVFTNPHHGLVAVRLNARGSGGAPAATLTAYDLGGNTVASENDLVGQDARFVIFAISSGGDIARFTIESSNALLYADDLVFDTLTDEAGPDFSVSGAAATLVPGGTTTVGIRVNRFAGSVGAITLAVSGLPREVEVVSIDPNPVTGFDGRARLTLHATPLATPVQDLPVALSGTPSLSAGSYGPHSTTFPLTIVDSYDAQIVGIEVTQGVQVYDLPTGSTGGAPLHGIPVLYAGVGLAAGGKTVVNAFPDFAAFPEHSPVPDFQCSLAGTRGGAPLPGSPIYSATGPGGLILGVNFVSDIMRARPNGVCTFVLPPEWTHGSISLTASLVPMPVFGPPVSGDCCADNDSFTVTGIPFTPTRELSIAPFALRVNRQGLRPPDDIFAEATNLLPLADGQFFPGPFVGELDITDIWNQDLKACGFLGGDFCPENDLGRGTSVVNRLRAVADDMNFTDPSRLVFGVYPTSDPVSGLSDRIRGQASPDQALAIVQVDGRPLTSVAHELGHLLGRPHASKDCGADNTDVTGPAEDWAPDQHGYLQGVGTDRRPAFPTVLFTDRHGSNLGGPFFDYMSYCAADSNGWISTRGWNELLGRLATGVPGSGSAQIASRIREDRDERDAEETLTVQASIDEDGNASITKVGPAHQPVLPPPGDSPFHLVARGASGCVLLDTPMAMSIGHVDDGPEVRFLGARVAVAGVHAVQITQDGQLIAQRVRSRHSPRVRSVTVGGHRRCDDHYREKCDDDRDDGARSTAAPGSVLVRWSSHDADGDALLATVDYSTDGGRIWRVVFAGPDRGEARLAAGMLAHAPRALVRVRVSDGFNEGSARSDEFSSAGAPPTVRIFSPAAPTTFHKGDAVYLSGAALDDRRAAISGVRLSWFAGQTLLGTGGALSVTTLPAGPSTVRLVAVDDDGRTSEAAVTVQVQP